MYCNEVEQSNAGCNEIELNIIAKLLNMSRGERIQKKRRNENKKLKNSGDRY